MGRRTKKGLSLASQQSIAGYLFILPFSIGFVFIVAIPLILAVIMSFTNLRYLNLWRKTNFIGLTNFVNIFKDSYAIDSITKSVQYALIFIPLALILGFVFALLINEKLYARNAIRTMIFLPYVSNISAIALIWSMILDPIDGPVNKMLNMIGVTNPPMWLVDKDLALATCAMIVVWMTVGFYFITYLAALQGVPAELYEAAKIDGAGYFSKLTNITIPSISGTIFFLTITAIIMAFQNFSPIKVLTAGGPGDASTVLAINVYNEAFNNSNVAYANSQSVLVFAVLILLTRVLMTFQKKWST